MAPFEAWKRDPVTYSGPITSGVFALFLHRLRPDEELAEAATARLDAVGPLVDAGIANLDAEPRAPPDRGARPERRAWARCATSATSRGRTSRTIPPASG